MSNNHVSETICALATVQGVSAVSIIRLSGPKAIEITDKMAQTPRNTPKHEYYKREFTTTMANLDSLDTKSKKYKLSTIKRESCGIGEAGQTSPMEKFLKEYKENCKQSFDSKKDPEHFDLLGPFVP
jgi:hypothetical protein